jgi:inner membrane protein
MPRPTFPKNIAVARNTSSAKTPARISRLPCISAGFNQLRQMPSAFTHAFMPLAVGLGLGREAISRRLLLVGMACAALPDVDVLAFRLGIAYQSPWGHRGFTHSFVFSFGLGVLAAVRCRWLKSERRAAFWFVFLATLSHALLDAATDGGLGVALWWPFSQTRIFWPFTPIEVSPISLRRFFSGRGLAVVASELRWVWLPAAVSGLGLFAWRHKAKD